MKDEKLTLLMNFHKFEKNSSLDFIIKSAHMQEVFRSASKGAGQKSR